MRWLPFYFFASSAFAFHPSPLLLSSRLRQPSASTSTTTTTTTTTFSSSTSSSPSISEGEGAASAHHSKHFPSERYRKNKALYRQLKLDDDEQASSRPVLRQAKPVKPKILAPAGGWAQLKAAVAAGADACYFGCNEGLNARARAENFDIDELGEVMRFLHERGVHGYLCMNILVFDTELSAAEDLVRRAALAGTDAIIVQDVGLATAARRVAPGLPIHASTQMSVTEGSGARFAADHLGAETVVVGRELSIADIASVVDALRHDDDGSDGEADQEEMRDLATENEDEDEGRRGGDAGASSRRSVEGVRVEAFVHGALCVSYSGQCFSSEAWGGRSANRGQCAQACRMPYGLVVGGELRHLIDDASYLLSPQDFMGLSRVPELVAAGVDTFKIEGRLKGPEYVFTTTRAYREALDVAWDDLHALAASKAKAGTEAGAGAAAGTAADSDSAADSAAGGGNAAAAFLPSPSRRLPASSPSTMVPSREHLAQVFSRGQDAAHDGLSVGFLDGPQHQTVVRGRAPKHRGLLVGEVVRVLPLPGNARMTGNNRGKGGRGRGGGSGGGGRGKGSGRASSSSERKEYGVVVHLKHAVKRGDGLVFDGGRPEDDELGGSIFGLFPTDAPGVAGREYAPEELSAGMNVVLTFGPELSSRLANSNNHHHHHNNNNKNKKKQQQPSLQPGDLVWRTRDVALEKVVRSAIASDDLARARTEVSVAVGGSAGAPLTVTIEDAEGRRGVGETTSPLEEAHGKPLTREAVAKALGTLGDSPFSIANGGKPSFDGAEEWLAPAGEGGSEEEEKGSRSSLWRPLWVPVGEIKAARRDAVNDILEKRVNEPAAAIAAGLDSLPAQNPLPPAVEDAIANTLAHGALDSSSSSSRAVSGEENDDDDEIAARRDDGYTVSVLCRSKAQVEAAIEIERCDEIVIDFLEARGVEAAIAKIRGSSSSGGGGTKKRVVVAAPRVIKPDEQNLYRWLLEIEPDAILVRSAGLLQQLVAANATGAPQLHGDFSLNAANSLTVQTFFDLVNGAGGGRDGPRLESLTPSHDLNAAQLASLQAADFPLECVIHQHLPIFHTEHCVFCRFLSDGNSYKDCGHPCETSTVHLRGVDGKDNLVLADMGCRNTVFNAEAQTGAPYLDWFARAGYSRFRIEFVDEPAEYVGRVVDSYVKVLDLAFAKEGRRISSSSGSSSGSLGRGEGGDAFVSDDDYWPEVEALLATLSEVPDANGRKHGVSEGSLKPSEERKWDTLRPTAAAARRR